MTKSPDGCFTLTLQARREITELSNKAFLGHFLAVLSFTNLIRFDFWCQGEEGFTTMFL